MIFRTAGNKCNENNNDYAIFAAAKPVDGSETPNLTPQVTTSNLLSRNSIGVVFTLLAGVGVIFLPTTAKLAYESGSNLITLIEPPSVAPVVWLIFGDTFSGLQWVGFATVLSSLFMFKLLARSD